eukprot:1159350-Pelagomonas_calceolata.AAC.3
MLHDINTPASSSKAYCWRHTDRIVDARQVGQVKWREGAIGLHYKLQPHNKQAASWALSGTSKKSQISGTEFLHPSSEQGHRAQSGCMAEGQTRLKAPQQQFHLNFHGS